MKTSSCRGLLLVTIPCMSVLLAGQALAQRTGPAPVQSQVKEPIFATVKLACEFETMSKGGFGGPNAKISGVFARNTSTNAIPIGMKVRWKMKVTKMGGIGGKPGGFTSTYPSGETPLPKGLAIGRKVKLTEVMGLSVSDCEAVAGV